MKMKQSTKLLFFIEMAMANMLVRKQCITNYTNMHLTTFPNAKMICISYTSTPKCSRFVHVQVITAIYSCGILLLGYAQLTVVQNMWAIV